MNNILDLQANSIIADTDEGVLTLNVWSGYQSRQGYYGSKDNEETSDGTVKRLSKERKLTMFRQLRNNK